MLSRKNNKNTENKVKSKHYVKYLVCLRDRLSMQSKMNKQGLYYRISLHGAIEFLEELTEGQYQELKVSLSKSGFILLDEKESMLIDRIISTIIEIIHYTDSLPKLSFSDVISEYDVSNNESILKIFSDVKGVSVLQFIVNQKIERAKELILYEDKSLEEIADILNYKNQYYLIAQFKKMTGHSPSYFNRLKKGRIKIAEEYLASSQSGIAGGSS